MADEKLKKLMEQRDQLNARIQKEKSKETERKRKLETQAKILLGQAVLSRLESKDEKADGIYRWCRDTLTDKDKARLDEALGKKATTTSKPTNSENNTRQPEKTTS